MSLAAGTRLGPYEIDVLLGAGGMGEVYRARDTRLDRIVAVKVLSSQLAADPEFRERFDREARAISSLSDPHICPLFDVGEAPAPSSQPPASSHEPPATVRFLVMEYLEGETLAARLATGALSLGQALSYAVEIASALDAAHRRGIVHRDLKPGNVMVTRTGTKLLDFGLAKSAGRPNDGAVSGGRAISPASLATALPTTPANLTAHGAILGTIQYMSPEQVQGGEADARSDIFAFGALVYEMVTGTKAFSGKNQFTVIGAILDHDPAPASQLTTAAPVALDRLIRKCLAKDPESRWQTARDLGSELEWIAESVAHPAETTSTAVAAAQPAKMRRARFLTTVAGSLVVGAALAGVVTWALVHSTPAPVPQPAHFAVAPTGSVPLAIGSPFRDIAISPDGTRLVYVVSSGVQNPQMMVRAIDQLEATPLRGLERSVSPFISPDSKWIGFFTLGNNLLKKVSMTGGPAITICRIQGNPLGASWGPDDTIVFATGDVSTGLLSVPAGGGESKILTKPDPKQSERDHLFPFVLPGGEAVLFTITTASGLDNSQVAALDLKTGQRKILIRGGGHAEYVDPSTHSTSSGQGGYLVYAASGTLRAVRFDPVRLEVLSDPVPIVEQVLTKATGAAEYSVSRHGGLVYVPGGVQGLGGGGAARSLVWVNRQGREEPIKAPGRAYQYLNLSPDGTKMAVEIRDQENDIWTWDFAHETLTRLTFDPGADSYPVWTSDSRRVIFSSARSSGSRNLYWQMADGTGTPEQLTTSPNDQRADSMSPDGSQLVLVEAGTGSQTSNGDLKVLHLPGPSTALDPGKMRTETLVQTAFMERNGQISPDGHWLAYESNESGEYQIYVRPFPNVNGGRWQVSPKGGTKSLWAPNGRELFFIADGYLTTVPVKTSPTFTSGNPTKVFETRYFAGNAERPYDVSRDGQKFLMVKEEGSGEQTQTATASAQTQTSMIVVLNWFEELKARVGPK